MEITFRTAAAPASIRNVAENCPEMLVGAGTVLTLEQCRTAVEMGAEFIVSPGLNREVVAWCLKQNIPVIPGCVTPTEITMAVNMGLHVVKFFPANIYGGLKTMKNLSAVFSGVSFIPTGGVNAENVREYYSAPFVYAVGGSWVCPKAEIMAGNFSRITELCLQAREKVFGKEENHG